MVNLTLISLVVISYILVFGLVVVSFKETLEKDGYVTALNIIWFVLAFIFSPALLVGFIAMTVLVSIIHGCEYISKLLHKPLIVKKSLDKG